MGLPSIHQSFSPAVINFVATGDNAIVAAVASQSVGVYRIFLVVSAATNITFKDGAATALTGAISLPANGSITLDLQPLGSSPLGMEPWFVTSSGNAFIINQLGTAQVSGKLDFLQR